MTSHDPSGAARSHPRSVLYRDGVVHSATDPFAEALVVTAGTVSWLGSEDTVGTLGSVDEVVALDGALVAPAFVDARLAATRDWRAAVRHRVAHGVASVHLVVPADDDVLLADVVSTAGAVGAMGAAGAGGDAGGAAGRSESRSDVAEGLPDLQVVVRAPEDLPVRGSDGLAERLAGILDPAAAPSSGRPPLVVAVGVDARHPRLEEILLLTAETRIPIRILVEAERDLPGVLEHLTARHVTAGSRLELATSVAGTWAEPIASAGLAVTILGSGPAPLAALASVGVPLAFGSAPRDGGMTSPWSSVRTAVEHPDPAQRVSARAAFRAHTRGGWRAVAADHTGAGEIRLGAPAHLAVWEAAALAVQAPDGRLAAWSTDPRAGTPLLPVLDDEHVMPRCLWLTVGGTRVDATG